MPISTIEQEISPIAEIELFESIQKYASIGLWSFEVSSQRLRWSSETKRIHEVQDNYQPNLDTGLSFYKRGKSRNTITKLFERCLQHHESYDVELQIITAKKNSKWVRAIGKPVIVNDICEKVHGLFQDITEKKTKEKALEIKEELLRRTFDNALVGMAIVNLKGKWQKVNKSLCNTLGYSKTELRKISFADITHPEDIEKGIDAMRDMLNGVITNFETEKRYIHKDGTIIWALLSVSLIKDKTGSPLHFVAQINDLSQIKQSTNEIENLLNVTKKQNQRLLNFAHIVSHNLRSHSSNLEMLIGLAKTDFENISENKIFLMLNKAVDQLSDSISNLNEVASITSSTHLELESVDLNLALKNTIANLSALIYNTNTLIDLDVPDLSILGIPAYIDSIFLNLLSNAIKYRKDNCIAKIKISAISNRDTVQLKFSDNGKGINLEKYGDKIFGMYKTFHGNKDARGIGLFLSKNQMEAIGGDIGIESIPNEGTTFTLNFQKYERD